MFVWRAEEGGRATVEELEEHYALVNPVVKDATLVATVLKHSEDKPRDLILVFTDTCKRTQVRGKEAQVVGSLCTGVVLSLISLFY